MQKKKKAKKKLLSVSNDPLVFNMELLESLDCVPLLPWVQFHLQILTIAGKNLIGTIVCEPAPQVLLSTQGISLQLSHNKVVKTCQQPDHDLLVT